MGRRRLTQEEVSDKYQNLKDTLDYYKQKRADSNSDEEKNEYTKKISAAKKNLNNFKRQYVDRISPEIKHQEQQPKQTFQRTTIKEKLQQLRDKAEELLSKATTEEERKSIKERLYYAELRYKYSY